MTSARFTLPLQARSGRVGAGSDGEGMLARSPVASLILTPIGLAPWAITGRPLRPKSPRTAPPVSRPAPARLAVADVAYIVAGDIWVASSSGRERRRITFDGVNECPSVSHDGRKVAFVKIAKTALAERNGGPLWIADLRTGHARKVLGTKDVFAYMYQGLRLAQISVVARRQVDRLLGDQSDQSLARPSRFPCDGDGS